MKAEELKKIEKKFDDILNEMSDEGVWSEEDLVNLIYNNRRFNLVEIRNIIQADIDATDDDIRIKESLNK